MALYKAKVTNGVSINDCSVLYFTHFVLVVVRAGLVIVEPMRVLIPCRYIQFDTELIYLYCAFSCFGAPLFVFIWLV